MQILASKLILETVIQQGATSYEHPVDAMQKISEIDEFGGISKLRMVQLIKRSITASMNNDTIEYVKTQREIFDYSEQQEKENSSRKILEKNIFSNHIKRARNYTVESEQQQKTSGLFKLIKESTEVILENLKTPKRVAIISVEESYFYIFLARIRRLATMNKGITIVVALIVDSKNEKDRIKASNISV